SSSKERVSEESFRSPELGGMLLGGPDVLVSEIRGGTDSEGAMLPAPGAAGIDGGSGGKDDSACSIALASERYGFRADATSTGARGRRAFFPPCWSSLSGGLPTILC